MSSSSSTSNALASASNLNYVNHTQDYDYSSNKISSKIAGRHFAILTLLSTSWFERWKFPSFESAQSKSIFEVFRSIRHYQSLHEKVNTSELLSPNDLTQLDPMKCQSDEDMIYEATVETVEKGSQNERSTDLSHDFENKIFTLTLKDLSGNLTIKLKKRAHRCESSHPFRAC